MIPKDCKRLAEVDFPIAEVSKHAAREKSIRHGHPSTLHLWWARRPLAACRAMLLALLWPDPCDDLCPIEFKQKVRELLPGVQGEVGPTDADLRKALVTFIGTFANWDLAANRVYLDVSRALVKAAHGKEAPLVVDPFAGGGSIPLEALRVGCEVFASDLNPVACLILKVLLEDIPRHGPELADELRQVGSKIKQQAEKDLAEFYPNDPDGSKPIAYLWARTVRCESPDCGAEIPLMRSFWLCKKPNRKRALRYHVNKQKERGTCPEVEFEVFEPKAEKDVPNGTVTRAKARCLCCNLVLSPERVRAQLASQRGGADAIFDPSPHPSPGGRGSEGEGLPMRIGGARLLAVVTLKPGEQGRHYRVSTQNDYEAVWKAQQKVQAIIDDWEQEGRKGLCPVPDEPLPPIGTLGFRVQRYGMLQWGDLFTARQKVALTDLVVIVAERKVSSLAPFLACALNRVTMSDMSCTRWNAVAEKMQHTFGRQALPIVWDFAEVVVTADAPGNWKSGYELIADIVDAARITGSAQTQSIDATNYPLPDETANVWFTDPPYYDAVPYADLSDFFFVWLKRALPGHPLLRDPSDPTNLLTPKAGEAVQNERSLTVDGKPKDQAFYENAMARAFTEGRRVLHEDGIGSVVFAHKTTEGWEALLSGLIKSGKGGWTITGSWPIATEMGSRLRARDSAALGTSVHLVCRPRGEHARVGDWGDVLRELPQRVGAWMDHLQSEGVRGADLVFACIGPALEIFSRSARVETAEGREVTLAEYLEKVWEVVGRMALEEVLGTAEARAKNGAVSALEEDARLTALFLWTMQSTSAEDPSPQPSPSGRGNEEQERVPEDGPAEDEADDEEGAGKKPKGYTLVFDVVRRFAQPLGINLPVWEGRIVDTKKGVVRLLPVSERAKQLFGEDGAQAVANQLEQRAAPEILQQSLFPEVHESVPVKTKGRGRTKKGAKPVPDESVQAHAEATTLDRVHAAMLLQASGRTHALRSLLQAEQERGPDFLRLANALSALYPKGSEEKRLLDAMLLAVPR